MTEARPEAQAAQTSNQYPPITTEIIYQHVQANQARHFLRVSWKDGIDIEEPTHSVEYLLHAYADAAREGWASPEEVRTLRAEKDRLATCLEKANINAEHFEREWYLRGDELDTLRAQLAEAQRDTERLDWIEKIALRELPSPPRSGMWKFCDELIVGMSLRAAIDAAKGEPS